MVVSKHAVAGVLVIVLGTAGAQLFRKKQQDASSDQPDAANSELTWRSPDVARASQADQVAPFPQHAKTARLADAPALLSLHAPPESPLIGPSALPLPIHLDSNERSDPIADPVVPVTDSESVRRETGSSEPPRSEAGRSETSPRMPVLLEPGKPETELDASPGSHPAADSRSPGSTEFRPPERKPEVEPATMRAHVVRDGDSLEDLAERYLGSRDRWSEIYEANRELLSNPELLPIGKELQIPRGGRKRAELIPMDADGLQALRQSAWPER